MKKTFTNLRYSLLTYSAMGEEVREEENADIHAEAQTPTRWSRWGGKSHHACTYAHSQTHNTGRDSSNI